jgi:galactofuranose transport system permease protein
MTAARLARVPRWRIDRKFMPLIATMGLFVLTYTAGMGAFPGMRDPQSFFNLFITTPFLLISVVGETLVIITGGIDLSVSGVVALTTVAAAVLLRSGMDPMLVIPLMLLMGVMIGAVMGFFITYLKVQPFIATLAGMWFARGLCYVISDAEVRIYDHTWKLLSGTKILIPGLADPVTKKGDYVTILVVVAVLLLVAGLYLAHLTRFGRTIYAIGGNGGANEVSARLMGLPVNRTKMGVYMLNGFCSALAGLAYSVYVGSGHGTHATGFELTVIAAVVIGGTALTGGEGYLLGSLFGVLITALIQSLIQFNGQLSSWWTSIVIGGLMLLFIGVQGLLTRGVRTRGLAGPATGPRRRRRRQRQFVLGMVAAVTVIAIGYGVVGIGRAGSDGSGGSAAAACTRKPFRQEQAASLVAAGAVIVYERNGGSGCIDELFAIGADGKVTGDDGTRQVTAQLTSDQVTGLVKDISDLGWFTDRMYSTSHTPCAQCYTYFTSVTADGPPKTVQAVDGGTDAPAAYWLITGKLSAILPRFEVAP